MFGSGPLLLRGWITEVGDLDVVSRGEAWIRAQELGTPSIVEDGNTISVIGDGITVGHTWAFGSVDIDHLIDTAEIIEGVPCVRLEHIIEYKKIADRPRDREHLAIIASHE